MLYLAGPMRGLPDFNYAAFHKAAFDMRALGHQVFNPAEHHYAYEIGGIDGCLALDFQVLIGLCHEGVVVLDGWERSNGARAEVFCTLALGRPVYRWHKHDLMEVSIDDYLVRK